MNHVLNKLSVVCFITRRHVHILNIETLNVVYFAHFHSLIKYSTIFWGNSTTIHKAFIFKKKKAIKNFVGNRSKIFQ
jgi:hypothetical protein